MGKDNHMEEKFTEIYRNQLWRGGITDGTLSGRGSTMASTVSVRNELPALMRRLGVRVFLDAPCGDFHWMKSVVLPEKVIYLGGDIVWEMIRSLQDTYGGRDRLFLHLDISSHPLPRADLWLCRDCLFHLPTASIFSVLENFVRSDIPYLLATTHLNISENTDIDPGGFRLLSLLQPPYSLPDPGWTIDEGTHNGVQRIIGLWEKSDVLKALGRK